VDALEGGHASRGSQLCGRGADKHEAELEIENGRAIFEEVELLK
jgi:hypothetical protein